tara:strand:+ start:2248 stop:2487 length:240 start_codon:yes stop_codon:yes gene_type:complete
MTGPYKMKGFSGFGNSPMKAGKTKFKDKVKAAGKAFVAGAKATDQGINKAIAKYQSEKKKAREKDREREVKKDKDKNQA